MGAGTAAGGGRLIRSVPASILVLLVFVGINMMNAIVDSSGDPVAQKHFHAAKGASTFFKGFSLLMLVMGLYSYLIDAANAVFRPLPFLRRVSDVVGLAVFASSLYVSLGLVAPLEAQLVSGVAAAAEPLFRLRLVAFALQLLQIAQQVTSFASQGTATKQTPNKKKSA